MIDKDKPVGIGYDQGIKPGGVIHVGAGQDISVGLVFQFESEIFTQYLFKIGIR